MSSHEIAFDSISMGSMGLWDSASRSCMTLSPSKPSSRRLTGFIRRPTKSIVSTEVNRRLRVKKSAMVMVALKKTCSRGQTLRSRTSTSLLGNCCANCAANCGDRGTDNIVSRFSAPNRDRAPSLVDTLFHNMPPIQFGSIICVAATPRLPSINSDALTFLMPTSDT